MRYAKLPKTLPDLLADEFATCRIGVRQQHCELFSTIPGGQIGGSARLGRALSNKQKAVLNTSRYFFDVKNGHRLVDPAGLDCSDDEEAISDAQTIARLIARETPTDAERKVAWWMTKIAKSTPCLWRITRNKASLSA
jgi:hypothetical protein